MLAYTPTPTVLLNDAAFTSAGVEVFVKREDLNHPYASGNKWWKLKFNLERAISEGHHTLLTFGGAYSNHIYATAAAAREVGLKSIGVIRGEEVKPLNQTLSFAKDAGMQLHYVSRGDYRNKSQATFIDELHKQFGRFYFIDEGGSNELGVEGMSSFAQSLSLHYEYVFCAVGTGASLAGLVRGRKGDGQIVGVPVLKGGDAWIKEVEKFSPGYDNWQLLVDYHFGGYAKSTHVLEQFIRQFKARHGIPIEHVYTAKMFYALYDRVAAGFFETGSRILALHTGGLQVPDFSGYAT